MARVLPALGLSVLLALAGCIVPEDLREAEDAALEAAAVAAEGGSLWYSLPIAAGPEAPLVSAWLTIPEGTVHPYAHNADFDTDYDVLPVELAFVFEGTVTPQAVALLTFRHVDGELSPSMTMVSVPGTLELSESLLFPGVSDSWEPSLAPAFYHLAFDEDLEAGDRIGIVAGVKSAESASGQLLMRLRGADEGDFQEDEEPEDDILAFAAEAKTPRLLEVLGHGAGIHAAERYESRGSLGMPIDIVFQSGEVTVEGGPTPEGAPVRTGRASSWSAGDASPQGWSHGLAAYISDFAVGTWTGAVQARDEQAEASGDVMTLPPGIFTTFELVTAMGDGAGPASATLDVAVEGTPNMESLVLLLYGIGTPVSELFGEPAQTHSDTFTAGGPLRHDATGWSLPVGGARVMMPALPEP